MACNKECACQACQLKKRLLKDAIIIGGAVATMEKMFDLGLLGEQDMTGFIQMCANLVAAYTIKAPEDKKDDESTKEAAKESAKKNDSGC